MPKHDNSYKLFFSHPRMVEDLLRGFVKEKWVEKADFSTLAKVSGSFVSDDLRDREDDVIWKVRWGEEWLYVYLLLEFQSTVDPFMSVRIMAYIALLYQDLIRQKQLSQRGKLPPVLPIVIYNGMKKWTAERDVSEVIEGIPGGLDRYRPKLFYFLVDEGNLGKAGFPQGENLASALFQLENSREPAEIRRILVGLAEWLKKPEQTRLRRTFTVWVKRVLLPARIPGTPIPEVQDLQEVNAMLAERVIEWTKQWKEDGLNEGRKEAVLEILTSRFGQIPKDIRKGIEKKVETEFLRNLLRKTIVVETLEEFRAHLNPSPPNVVIRRKPKITK